MTKESIKNSIIFGATIALLMTTSTAIIAGGHKDKGGHKGSHTQELTEAIAVIYPTKGNTASGVLRFTQQKKGVLVTGEFSGLSPNAKHGFHVHQFGDASSKDGKSAGSHYNPDNHPHGLPPATKRHAGSFGNLESDKFGRARFKLLDSSISIKGAKNPVLGRSVIIHAKEDTGAQPLGNAGARIGIGIIGIANPSQTGQ